MAYCTKELWSFFLFVPGTVLQGRGPIDIIQQLPGTYWYSRLYDTFVSIRRLAKPIYVGTAEASEWEMYRG